LVSKERNKWMSWYIRKEKTGALLWNPDTNRVFELDDEAYNVLMTLQEGTGFEKAIQEHGIKAGDLYTLLAQISEPQEKPGQRKS
jgi:hypothetical protein